MRPHRIRTGLWSLLAATAVVFAGTNSASAQDTKRGPEVGVAGKGSDMWTQAMSGLGLFTPHRDDCNATTEVFVKVYAENSVDFGFCMDKDEHSSGAKNWEDARKECLDDGKRLPEPGEWKYACDSIAGLNNMTDDYEWASNFWSMQRKSSANWWRGVSAPVFGNNGCQYAEHSHIGKLDGLTIGSLPFRCVR